MDGVWGDDVELQALSEIYARPIEIYAYQSTPMRTFHEDSVGTDAGAERKDHQEQPIRLSYHGKEHYNSIVPLEVEGKHEEKKVERGLQERRKEAPGEREAEAVRTSHLRRERRGQAPNHSQMEEAKGKGGERDRNDQVHAIARSRLEFEARGKRDMQVAMEESLSLYQNQLSSLEEEAIASSKTEFEEQQLLQLAMKESIKDAPSQALSFSLLSSREPPISTAFSGLPGLRNQASGFQREGLSEEEEELQRALQMSKQELGDQSLVGGGHPSLTSSEPS